MWCHVFTQCQSGIVTVSHVYTMLIFVRFYPRVTCFHRVRVRVDLNSVFKVQIYWIFLPLLLIFLGFGHIKSKLLHFSTSGSGNVKTTITFNFQITCFSKTLYFFEKTPCLVKFLVKFANSSWPCDWSHVYIPKP